jgi:putative ABC transport system permease protein
MRPYDYLTGALEDIWATKLRSFLTSLGIIIGVGSVVLMMSIGAGVNSTVTGAFSDLGSTQITISPSAPRSAESEQDDEFRGGGGGRGGEFGVNVASTLTTDDAVAIADVEGVAAVAPVIQVPIKVVGPAKTLDVAVTGTTSAHAAVTNQELITGRVFSDDGGEVVLNEAAAAQLFDDAAALGATVTIKDQSFTVAGIFKNAISPFAQGRPGGDNEAQAQPAIFVPIEQALEMAGTEHVAQIVLTAESPEGVDATMERVRTVLLNQHEGVADFSITSFQELLSSFSEIFDVLTLFLAAIAGISLVVGGIGIMNIMLASVTERTREIGIAKAIGATRRHVVAQFLVEAVMLSALGGVIGLAVAWLGTVLLKQTLDLPAIISPATIALAIGVSAAIGVFFGVAPAWRAARLDPIVALRHE